eukprot:COSAG05_NODE_2775_length_2652_cov_2.252252_1_plen_56_part_00
MVVVGARCRSERGDKAAAAIGVPPGLHDWAQPGARMAFHRPPRRECRNAEANHTA